MKIEDVLNSPKVDFTGIESSYFLIGLLTAFDNRFQAKADRRIGKISWKQYFALICMHLCKEAPTIKELSEIMGSSHQNVKQILLKLEKQGFVAFRADEQDRRKQRIDLTEQCRAFCAESGEDAERFMAGLFRGISKEQLETTIHTILAIENNLKDL